MTHDDNEVFFGYQSGPNGTNMILSMIGFLMDSRQVRVLFSLIPTILTMILYCNIIMIIKIFLN